MWHKCYNKKKRISSRSPDFPPRLNAFHMRGRRCSLDKYFINKLLCAINRYKKTRKIIFSCNMLVIFDHLLKHLTFDISLHQFCTYYRKKILIMRYVKTVQNLFKDRRCGNNLFFKNSIHWRPFIDKYDSAVGNILGGLKFSESANNG